MPTEEKERKLTDQEIEAALRQSSAMVKIADGYDTTEEENEIARKCFKGEMTWEEGFKKILDLPIPKEDCTKKE